MEGRRLLRVASRKTYVLHAIRVLNAANDPWFTAGSGKSVLWYVVLQLVMYKVTYDIP